MPIPPRTATSSTPSRRITSPGKSSTRFADLIEIPKGEEKHILDFEFQLVGLYRMPFEKILGTPMGILTLRGLKAELLQALLDDPVWDEALMLQLPSVSFEMLMRYILDRDTDMLFSKQQDILEALEIRFNRVPEGLREEIELLADIAKLEEFAESL